ncbi:unnamed protein product [Darwinula stevensoni]|uniref:Methylosome subunit pICln n=1 Tax=Darwinula stevensoni TaxID=69355 RepID=A0A7R8XG11_9CRUS|nr:unnamed protein product [Darwinula stevensoni]CAG0896038.1 unnamed protein product [Darwinula stevensoni]
MVIESELISSLPPPTENVKIHQPQTLAFVNHEDLGKGTLYIGESHLSWVHESGQPVLSFNYMDICIHAISRDSSSFPHPCLYMMLDNSSRTENLGPENAHNIDRGALDGVVIRGPGGNDEEMDVGDAVNGEDDDDNDGPDQGDGGTPGTMEVRLVPEDPAILESMFQAMSECQTLHQDPNQPVYDGYPGGADPVDTNK